MTLPQTHQAPQDDSDVSLNTGSSEPQCEQRGIQRLYLRHSETAVSLARACLVCLYFLFLFPWKEARQERVWVSVCFWSHLIRFLGVVMSVCVSVICAIWHCVSSSFSFSFPLSLPPLPSFPHLSYPLLIPHPPTFLLSLLPPFDFLSPSSLSPKRPESRSSPCFLPPKRKTETGRRPKGHRRRLKFSTAARDGVVSQAATRGAARGRGGVDVIFSCMANLLHVICFV